MENDRSTRPSPGTQGTSLNWEEAYARLTRFQQALERGSSLDQDREAEMLRTRAAELAKPLETDRVPTETLDLVVFPLAGESYALEASAVEEVVLPRGLTAVPCTPSFIAGVLNYRGRLLTTFDLRALLDLRGEPEGTERQVVAVAAGGLLFGILTDGAVQLRQIDLAELSAPPADVSGLRKAFLRGVTPDMVLVLAHDILARSPELIVNEEVG